MKYLIQRNSVTGETRRVAVKSTGAKFLDTVAKVPIIGDISEVVRGVGAGIATKIKNPQIEKETMAMQERSRQLALAARKELDPSTKKSMLDESRSLSREAGKKANDFNETVQQSMPEFAKGNKESPASMKMFNSPSEIGSQIKAYGIPSLKAGIAVGDLMTLGLLGPTGGLPKLGPQGSGIMKAIGRIGTKTAVGTGEGAVRGYLQGENKTQEERVESSKTGATIGGVAGLLFGTGEEVVSGVKNKIIPKIKSILDKEKARKYEQLVNPQVKPGIHYLEKKTNIVDYSKQIPGDKPVEKLVNASKRWEENTKKIIPMLKDSKVKIGSEKAYDLVTDAIDKVPGALKEATENGHVDWLNKEVYKALGGDGNIDPVKLYETYGTIGDKKYTVSKEMKPLYDQVYADMGKMIDNFSPEARKLIADNYQLRLLTDGLSRTVNKLGKKGIMDTIKKYGSTALGIGGGISLLSSLSRLTKK